MEKQSSKAHTRQRILDEAARVMRETGTEGIGVAALVSEVAHLPQPTRQIFAQGFNTMHAGLAQILRELRLPDVEALASSMLAEMVGALALARACPDAEQASQMLQRSRDALKQRTLEVAA